MLHENRKEKTSNASHEKCPLCFLSPSFQLTPPPNNTRSWKEEFEAARSSGVDGDESGGKDGEEASGTGKQSVSPGDGEDPKKIADATVRRGGVFTPTPEQVRVARHLGHRLELARTVAAGVREKIADLKQQLEAQAREVRRRCKQKHRPIPFPLRITFCCLVYLFILEPHPSKPFLSLSQAE